MQKYPVTRLEYFAAQAMKVALRECLKSEFCPVYVAGIAFRMADEMEELAVRRSIQHSD
jgi:hypothetical protein